MAALQAMRRFVAPRSAFRCVLVSPRCRRRRRRQLRFSAVRCVRASGPCRSCSSDRMPSSTPSAVPKRKVVPSGVLRHSRGCSVAHDRLRRSLASAACVGYGRSRFSRLIWSLRVPLTAALLYPSSSVVSYF